ncbi:MAG: ABC transporter substrate-binding protein [Candidatus Aminicenantes bacterium]|nr:ABC transporter substrate-binding protein [Candidatus Aminicenantes bacterium]
MTKKLPVCFLLLISILSCAPEGDGLYTIAIFQVNDAPTLNVVREAFIQALSDNGLKDGENVTLIIKNAMGDIPEVQRIAQDFVIRKVDMIVAFSTPSFQAAMHATKDIPVVFSSVANPYLAGAGESSDSRVPNVAGVSSEGPIKETLAFIKEVLPSAERIGTLWTPSELNSKYYLDLAIESADRLGMEIVAVPIANSSEVLLSTQVLINEKVDAIYQISDNTINAAFEAVGKIAEENGVPLFGGQPYSTQLGACAAMGWDFFDMGYKAGEIALRIKNGEAPADIPFQYMQEVQLHLNLEAAQKQGVHFSQDVLRRADEILPKTERISGNV